MKIASYSSLLFLMSGMLLMAPLHAAQIARAHRNLNWFEGRSQAFRTATYLTAAGAALSLAIYIVAKIDQYFQMTDEELLLDSKKLLEHSRQELAPIQAVFNTLSPSDSPSALEPYLYELAQLCLSHHNVSYDHFITNFKNTEHRITKRINELNKRISKLKKKREAYSIIEKMEDSIHHLGLLHAQWLSIQTFMSRHACYFILYASEAELLKKYSKEMGYFEHYKHDPHALKHLLKSLVTESEKGIYKFAEYVEKLTVARDRLKKALENCYSYYPHRINAATALMQSLEWIRGVITSEDSYVKEIQQREHDREVARLDAERWAHQIAMAAQKERIKAELQAEKEKLQKLQAEVNQQKQNAQTTHHYYHVQPAQAQPYRPTPEEQYNAHVDQILKEVAPPPSFVPEMTPEEQHNAFVEEIKNQQAPPPSFIPTNP